MTKNCHHKLLKMIWLAKYRLCVLCEDRCHIKCGLVITWLCADVTVQVNCTFCSRTNAGCSTVCVHVNLPLRGRLGCQGMTLG